ncbi:MAG: DciA family protein [Planctomycetota bacterium]|jgi:predicted nucleic acid-binding Zn ribbon protein
MDEDERLRNAVEYRRARKSYSAVRLGQAAQQLMAEQISPRQARFSEVAEVWSQLLPAEMCRHCEIVDISGGQLAVQVDSPSYMYELQLCSSELLKELQQHCSKARLTKIKFVVA